jgi:hypothetical protein
MDTANSEKLVVSLGDPKVTARCEKTARLFEVGSGALSHAEQTANFVREAARDGDLPKSGESCDRTGRPYEVGRGCLTKTAQTAAFLREANPAKAAADDRFAKTVEAATEVKKLASDEEAALAALNNPFLNDNIAATKH